MSIYPPLALCHRVTWRDDRVTTFHTPCTTPSVTVARNLCVYACIHLHMLTVQNSEVEHFENFRGTYKVFDVSPLCQDRIPTLKGS